MAPRADSNGPRCDRCDVRAAAKKSEGADGGVVGAAGRLTAHPGRVDVRHRWPPGAGKSSLLSLIPRLYDATHGTVSVAGVDAIGASDRFGVRDWRAADVVLLNDTIAVNLRGPR